MIGEMYVAVAVQTFIIFCVVIFSLGYEFAKKSNYYFSAVALSYFLYNFFSGIFPDKELPVNYTVQIITSYTVGLWLIICVVFYNYHLYRITPLFFRLKESVILLGSILILVVIPVPKKGLHTTIFVAVATVLYFLNIRYLYLTLSYSDIKFKSVKTSVNYYLSYAASLFLLAMPVIVFFGDFQVLEQSIANVSFLLLCASFYLADAIESKYPLYLLSTSELELFKVLIINQNLTYREIGVGMNKAEKTISKQSSEIFRKLKIENRRVLNSTVSV